MKTFNMPPPPVERKVMGKPGKETAEFPWKPLYRIGAAAALSTVMLIIIAIPIFLVWPPPGDLLPTASTVIDSFALLQNNWLLGLLSFDLVMLVSAVLLIPIYLALYVSLRRASPSLMAIALTLGLVGIAAYFAVNPAFTMLSLSTHYAAATSEAQRALFVAAGLATLAGYQGTGFDMYYVLSAITMLITSFVMLRSAIFSKGTAYLGIAAGILMIVPATAGIIGVYLSLLSLLPLVAWYLLIAQRLLRLVRNLSQEEERQAIALF
jgi:hypothetical protein